MHGLNTERAPSISVVVPHFIIAACMFFVLSILLFISSQNLIGHFYQSKLLALTHITALGWITMIIIGSLYQLIPVVFENSLYSEKLALINIPIFSLGLSGLVYSFWMNYFGSLFNWSAIITALSLIAFSINILISVWSAKTINYSARFIMTALYWLILTSILGVLIALDHQYSFLETTNFRYLKIHAHFGIIGWFLQLIIGVSSVLIPMFLVSHDLDQRKLKISYYLINIGLIGLVLDWFLKFEGQFRPLFVLFAVLGIISYITFLKDAFDKRLRKFDIGMKLTIVAFISIILPLILGIIISMKYYLGTGIPNNFISLYGFTIFFAFITPLILGQTYKTLPFIIWLHHYQHLIGKKKTPMPADLYNNNIAEIHLWTYIASILAMSIGIMATLEILVQSGALLLIATSTLYLINVVKIVLHKTQSSPIDLPITDNKDNLMELVRTVIDPEVEINIVDMGLIYKLEYDNDKTVDIEMTLSTPNCPLADSIVMNVMETIVAKHPEYEVNVHLVFEPKWTPELISPAGKKALKEGHTWK